MGFFHAGARRRSPDMLRAYEPHSSVRALPAWERQDRRMRPLQAVHVLRLLGRLPSVNSASATTRCAVGCAAAVPAGTETATGDGAREQAFWFWKHFLGVEPLSRVLRAA